MAKFTISYHFNEVWVDVDGNFMRSFVEHLPHGRQIVIEAVRSWNETVQPSFLHSGYDDDIESVRAYPSHTDADAMNVIVELKKNKRWNASKREAIFNAVSIQFCDGWGEGFLGQVNTVEDEETHIRYYVE